MTDQDIIETIGALREDYHDCVDIHTTEKSMTNRIKAKCRRWCGGDKKAGNALYTRMEKGNMELDEAKLQFYLMPFFEARAQLTAHRKLQERRIEKLARRLPIWQWAEPVCGLGAKSIGFIVAEATNEESEGIERFDTVSKLWKRFGLAVIDGGRQRRCKNEAQAEEHGYSPRRRSVVWVAGEAILKKQSYFRQFYLHRLFHQVRKTHDDGLQFVTTMKDTVESWRKRGLPEPVLIKKSELDPDQHRTAMHLHNRAKREMEKELLKHIWLAWRDPARTPPVERDIDQLKGASA